VEKHLLEKWNPWWQVGTVPAERLGIAREEMLGTFLKLADAKEIVAINGVRRAGKSTLLYQIANSLILKGVPPANIFYFNFDEPTTGGGKKICLFRRIAECPGMGKMAQAAI